MQVSFRLIAVIVHSVHRSAHAAGIFNAEFFSYLASEILSFGINFVFKRNDFSDKFVQLVRFYIGIAAELRQVPYFLDEVPQKEAAWF